MVVRSPLSIESADRAQVFARGARLRRRGSGRQAGVALVQVIMAMGLVMLCGGGGLFAMVQINRKAAAMRMLNNARAVVQRNIDSALGVPFNATLEPPILALTSNAGAVYDDDGGGDNQVNILMPHNGTEAKVRGTLTRTVTDEPNPEGATVRRVNFRLDYTYRSRPYSYEMTTVRAMD